MTNWYQFEPVDTLYFRGAEPMNLGENHTTSHVFPPPAQTLSGALRTSVLMQQSISIEAYAKGKAPKEIYDAIGKGGERAPFDLIGPFFLDKEIYIPAPYSWFMEKNSSDNKNDKLEIVKGKFLQSRLLKSEKPDFIWAKAKNQEMVSLGGMWIQHQDLYSDKTSIVVKKSEAFFENEPRTGIALEKNRKVREGHLYSFNHARLKKEVSIIFGTNKTLPIQDQGVLKIGAEQRFGWYKKLTGQTIQFNGTGNFFVSLSIMEGSEDVNRSVVATGKILYFGGWDLHTGFHKPMKGFFPAGSVFNKKINNHFVAIKGVESC
ncbi:MAG: hypothetical protein HQK77_12285 [Desulfobacterales bacterium]|nr:hypothetical protein [Desulfobacterales bacterium]